MNIDRYFKGVFVIWIIGAIMSLSITGGLIWVAVHFIRKFW
jgi:hypothetical protein